MSIETRQQSIPEHHKRLPSIDLRQMLRLTDDTGILQHATYSVPDHHHGYCVDDNCRALIAGLLHAKLRGYDEQHVPVHRYLAFIAYALNPEKGRFRNFMSYARNWLEEVGSEDSHGRTLWSLGVAADLAPDETIRGLAMRLFRAALPVAETFPYVRSTAFTLLGLDAYQRADPSDTEAAAMRQRLAEKLYAAFQQNASSDWPWWDNTLTYDNAKLPHALLVSGHALGRQDMQEDALRCLRWIIDAQTAEQGHLATVGNDGWYPKGGTMARFDQQPLEAHAIVEASLAAARLTGDAAWRDLAFWAFSWFTGHNDLGVSLYNPDTGGCHDGLKVSGVNANQGAESTLAYVLSVQELHFDAARGGAPARAAAPETLGLGILGASDFAAFCLQHYRPLAGLEPVAVWSRTSEHARRFAQQHEVEAIGELDTLLADERIHVVHIATLPAAHRDLAVRALAAGKHVLIEKPLATTLLDAHQILHAAAEQDRRLAVNFVMRFSPLQEAVSTILSERLLGRLVRGAATNRAGDRGLPDDHWFWDHAKSGGIFVEHGVHFFDLWQSWLGPARVSWGHQDHRPGHPAIVDQVDCELVYHAGGSASFHHAFVNPPQLDRQDHRLILERGQIRLEGWIPNRLELEAVLSESMAERLRAALPAGARLEQTQRLSGDEAQASRRLGEEPVDGVYRASYRDERDDAALYGAAAQRLMEDLLQSVRHPTQTPTASGRDGLAALETALVADRLAKQV